MLSNVPLVLRYGKISNCAYVKEKVLKNGATVNALCFGFFHFIFHQVLKNNPYSNTVF